MNSSNLEEVLIPKLFVLFEHDIVSYNGQDLASRISYSQARKEILRRDRISVTATLTQHLLKGMPQSDSLQNHELILAWAGIIRDLFEKRMAFQLGSPPPEEPQSWIDLIKGGPHALYITTTKSS